MVLQNEVSLFTTFKELKKKKNEKKRDQIPLYISRGHHHSSTFNEYRLRMMLVRVYHILLKPKKKKKKEKSGSPLRIALIY